MPDLADQVVAYVAAQTRRHCRGPTRSWSISVSEIATALDVDDGALQTAIRKAWQANRLHIAVVRGQDHAHAVLLGEVR